MNYKKLKTRNLLIKIAGKVFHTFGYKKTTMEDIAEAAGKGKSSIYYYFKSKDEIYQSVVLKEAVIFRRTIIDAIKKAEHPSDKIKVYVLTRMNIINIYTNFHSALKDEKLLTIDFVRRLNNLYDDEEIRLFKEILEEGVEKQYFKIYDIELAAVAIVMAMKGIESMLFRTNNKEIFTTRMDDLINIILYGIVKRG